MKMILGIESESNNSRPRPIGIARRGFWKDVGQCGDKVISGLRYVSQSTVTK